MATKTLNIQQAKTHLSRLVEEVLEGQDIVIAKAGKPKVRLVPHRALQTPRVRGQLEGQIWQADDCWQHGDSPLLAASGTPPATSSADLDPQP